MALTTISRTIPALLPLTEYVVRVRSYNNLGVASGWSEALLFTTDYSAYIPGVTFPTYVGSDLPGVHAFPVGKPTIDETYLYESTTVPSFWLYNGTEWIEIGGGGSSNFPTNSGTGTPEGIFSGVPGDSYRDTNTGAIYLKARGTSITGWIVMAGAAVDSAASPPISGVYEVAAGPLAATALAGEAVIIAGQKLMLMDVGAPTINGSGSKAFMALGTSPSGSNTLSVALMGAGLSGITAQSLTNGTTTIASTLTLQTTASTGGVQMSGPNLSLTATAGGVAFTSLGHGPVSLFAYSGNPNTYITAAAKGDLCVDTTTPGLWQASGAGTAWVAIGGSSGTKTFQTSQTYSISGTLTVPSGASGYLPPFYVPVASGQTATLTGVRHSLRAGSAGINITHNGSSFSSITTTTTPTTSTFSVSITSDDTFAPVITSVSGADGLSMSFYFTITE